MKVALTHCTQTFRDKHSPLFLGPDTNIFPFSATFTSNARLPSDMLLRKVTRHFKHSFIHGYRIERFPEFEQWGNIQFCIGGWHERCDDRDHGQDRLKNVEWLLPVNAKEQIVSYRLGEQGEKRSKHFRHFIGGEVSLTVLGDVEKNVDDVSSALIEKTAREYKRL